MQIVTKLRKCFIDRLTGSFLFVALDSPRQASAKSHFSIVDFDWTKNCHSEPSAAEMEAVKPRFTTILIARGNDTRPSGTSLVSLVHAACLANLSEVKTVPQQSRSRDHLLLLTHGISFFLVTPTLSHTHMTPKRS